MNHHDLLQDTEPGTGCGHDARAHPLISSEATTPAGVWHALAGRALHTWGEGRVARDMTTLCPTLPAVARVQQDFLRTATRQVLRSGLTQIIAVGASRSLRDDVLPTIRKAAPSTRIVAVDSALIDTDCAARGLADHASRLDPSRANVAGSAAGGSSVRCEQLPGEQMWREAVDTGLIDPDAPTGVLLIGVLHHLPDTEVTSTELGALRRRLAVGSLLAISHVTTCTRTPGQSLIVDRFRSRWSDAGIAFEPRTPQAILHFRGDWPVHPGMRRARCWPGAKQRWQCDELIGTGCTEPMARLSVGMARKTTSSSVPRPHRVPIGA